MSTQIFRKSALEKLSTPEKLDQLITVVDRKSWMPLIAIGLSVFGLVIWGIWGEVQTKVTAQGMLMGGGVHDIVPVAQGQLMEIKVDAEDTIAAGDVVAIIDQPVLEQQLAEAKSKLAQLKNQYQELKSYGAQDIKLQYDFNEQQEMNIHESMTIQNKSFAFLEEQLKTEKELYKKGLITKPQLVTTEQNLDQAKAQIDRLKAELKQLSSRALGTEYNMDQQLSMSMQSIEQHELYISQLEERYEDGSKVKSSYGGIILEVMVDRGEMLSPGLPMFKLIQRNENEKLRGVLFVASKDGKKIKKAHKVQVAPITVKPQEDGYMIGHVRSVSEYPATSRGVMRILKNEQLTQQMMMMGAPFKVEIDLLADSSTVSNFAWTSKKGPNNMVYGGTMCSAMISVESRAPITLVIPAVKKFFDLN